MNTQSNGRTNAAGLDVRSTFLSIARCSNLTLCLSGDASHPCSEIVRSQKTTEPSRFQLPEPWVGRIDVAPILFIASNPSIGDDDHATMDAADEGVWDSHHLAFGGGKRTYIIDGTKTTRRDGSPIKSVRYWSAIKARAAELIPDRTVDPGVDYAMTEVVHCKSVNEIGVAAAAQTCVDAHLESVLRVSPAAVIVAVGAFAKRWLCDGAEATIQRRSLGGRERLVTWLPHPTGFHGPKTFAKKIHAADLNVLRAAVHSYVNEAQR